jgi:hypothetical protein
MMRLMGITISLAAMLFGRPYGYRDEDALALVRTQPKQAFATADRDQRLACGGRQTRADNVPERLKLPACRRGRLQSFGAVAASLPSMGFSILIRTSSRAAVDCRLLSDVPHAFV